MSCTESQGLRLTSLTEETGERQVFAFGQKDFGFTKTLVLIKLSSGNAPQQCSTDVMPWSALQYILWSCVSGYFLITCDLESAGRHFHSVLLGNVYRHVSGVIPRTNIAMLVAWYLAHCSGVFILSLRETGFKNFLDRCFCTSLRDLKAVVWKSLCESRNRKTYSHHRLQLDDRLYAWGQSHAARQH